MGQGGCHTRLEVSSTAARNGILRLVEENIHVKDESYFNYKVVTHILPLLDVSQTFWCPVKIMGNLYQLQPGITCMQLLRKIWDIMMKRDNQ